MTLLGYALSSEEHRPAELIQHARLAEQAGFSFALISDHYHPWTDRQGQSSFVWSVLGALSQATSSIQLGTGVTCPTMRIHPAIIAQAAATAATLLPGRFFLGVGTGENLNEHILGEAWPAHDLRLARLEEAVTVLRLLWQGGTQTHRGTYYTVEQARIYTLPQEPIPLMMAASGPKTAAVAGRLADGFIGTSPEREMLEAYGSAGGTGPKYGQMTVCWAANEQEARQTALEWWPNAGLPGELSQELPLPAHFAQVAKLVDEKTLTKRVVCGPDSAHYRAMIDKYAEAGYDHIYLHQVGPDQAGFLKFCQQELLPHYQ